MRQTLTWAAVILGCVCAGIQLVPTVTGLKTASASEVRMAKMIDPQVGAILDRSCQDCHSNNTHLPWYGRVAPVSWIVSRDISRGREKLDFSQWAERPHSTNERMEICDAVSDGSMPLRAYTLFHSNAGLSKQDVNLICDWAAVPASSERPLQAGASDTAETLTSSNNVRRSNTKGSR